MAGMMGIELLVFENVLIDSKSFFGGDGVKVISSCCSLSSFFDVTSRSFLPSLSLFTTCTILFLASTGLGDCINNVERWLKEATHWH